MVTTLGKYDESLILATVQEDSSDGDSTPENRINSFLSHKNPKTGSGIKG